MKFIFKIILIFLSIIFFSCSTSSESQSRIVNGKIDVDNFTSFKVIDLVGEWEFSWMRLTLSKSDFNSKIIVPSTWGSSANESQFSEIGYGTYCIDITGLPKNKTLGLLIKDIATSYKVYYIDLEQGIEVSNPKFIIESGKVRSNKNDYSPSFMPSLSPLVSETGHVRLYIEVSNFNVDKGGIREALSIGLFRDVYRKIILDRGRQLILVGILLFIVIQNLFYFIQRPKEKTTIYFSIFSFLLLLRELSSGRLVWFLYGVENVSELFFNLWCKIELGSVYIMPLVFMLYLNSLFPGRVRRIYLKILIPFSIVVDAALIYFSLLDFLFILTYMQFLMLIVAIYSIYIFIRATFDRSTGAFVGLIGITIFVLTVINDILNSKEIIQTGYLIGSGFISFILSQTLLLSILYSKTMDKIELLNNSLNRFVPQQMIEYLGKKSILDVQLGDTKEMKMSVMFSDIRKFTSISESMTPEETFKFLNSYLCRISPIIRSHEGYIDKYLGDGILALFPKSSLESVISSLEIIDEVKIYNTHRHKSGYEPISIGIGLHTGNLILGTIGENKRIEGTVVADAVNLSSRLEELTKKYNAEIIVSREIIDDISTDKRVSFRYLGKELIRGRKKKVEIYQILWSEDPRNRYTTEFEYGIKTLKKDPERGKAIFKKLFQKYPADTTLEYLKDC